MPALVCILFLCHIFVVHGYTPNIVHHIHHVHLPSVPDWINTIWIILFTIFSINCGVIINLRGMYPPSYTVYILPEFGICDPCFARIVKYNVLGFLGSSQTRILYVLEHLHTGSILLEFWQNHHLLLQQTVVLGVPNRLDLENRSLENRTLRSWSHLVGMHLKLGHSYKPMMRVV